jgi:hypothetical protein
VVQALKVNSSYNIGNHNSSVVKSQFQGLLSLYGCPVSLKHLRFLCSQYVTSVNEEKIVQFYNSLGQKVPSKCVSIPSCQISHEIGTEGVNFTGVTVLLSSDNTNNCVKAKKDRKRYKRGSLEVSKREKQRIENQSKDKKALDQCHSKLLGCRHLKFSPPTPCT